MTRKTFYYLLFLVLFFGACNDDIELEPIPLEEQDEFMGELKSFALQQETAGWEDGNFRLKIMTEDGKVIVRSADHRRSSDESLFKMNAGLKTGVYRLLSAEIETKNSKDSVITRQYGLGGRIMIEKIDEEMRVKLLDLYDSVMGLTRQDSAYIISSVAHLIHLRDLANDEHKNRLLLKENVYRQVGPIDMRKVVVDRVSGWMPIGLAPTTAFRGTFIGDTLNPIKNLYINRGNTVGAGLFGYVQNFTAKNVTLQDADVRGHSFTGILAGAVVTSGNNRDQSYFYDCKLIDCKLEGADDGLSVGGLVGMVDQSADVLFLGCSTEKGSYSGAYNVGGLLGGSGQFSRVFMSDCVNESTPVTGKFNCVGGLIGVTDTLSMSVCLNKAEVIGGTDTSNGAIVTGTGGLVGGARTANLLACKNEAPVKGHWGVGGLVGSSRVATDEQGGAVFGNIYFQQCLNLADVSGSHGVGGFCGEAQFGGYGLYNGGKVHGELYVGGLCGKAAVAVTQNAINKGEVAGESRIGGLMGQVMTGSVTLCQNMGSIIANDGYAGGVIGLMGDNGIVHYCTNYASLNCSGKNPVGGIVGEVGDPRTWSKVDITYCVYGAIDMVMGPWCIGVDFATFKWVSRIDSVIGLFLGGSGFLLRKVFTSMEAAKQVLNFEGCFDEVTFAKINDEINAKENQWRSEVDGLLAETRDGNSVSYSTDNGLNNTLLGGPYMANFKENLNYCSSSEENAATFNANCNAKVNELAGEVKAREERKEVFHNTVSYITIAVGFVTGFVGMVTTAGTATALVAAAVGGVTTVIGGTNSVWRSIDNFEENAAIVSQCVNVGSISASEGKVGGIVGVLNDYCVLQDCLNAGSGPGSFARQLVREFGHKCSITNNLSIASLSGWGDYYDDSNSVYVKDYSNLIFDEDKYGCLDKTSIASQDEFRKKDWSIGGEQSLWIIPEAEYPHPIPNWSEMRK